MPALRRRLLPGGEGLRVAVLRPGDRPLESLASVLARLATNDATPVAKTREFVGELRRRNGDGQWDGLQRIARLNQWVSQCGYFVPAIAKTGLREAICRPAERAGYRFDEPTVAALVRDTEGREGALPLLQFALTRMWDGLLAGWEPAATLREIGGVGGALAGEAQRIYDGLDEEEQRIARRVFIGLVRLGKGVRDTRRRVAIASLI